MLRKKKILLLSDWNLANNGDGMSGYTNIAIDIGTKLSADHTVIAVGPSYRRSPHNLPFSLTTIPFQAIQPVMATISNFVRGLDYLIVCLDIPQQRQLAALDRKSIKYMGIFAVEADPLYPPWAMEMSKLDYRFAISEFGANECNRVGVDTQHYVVPTNREIWKPRTEQEKADIKDILGTKDKFVLFMNADGNERKNTSALFQAMDILINQRGLKNVYLYVLTQKNSPVAWNLGELQTRFKLTKNISILDRGLTYDEIRKLYVGADLFLNVTKAEGMSFPILEAMSVGVPVICTNATAMKDHVNGIPGENKPAAIGLDADFVHIDVFGNTNRFYVFPETIANAVEKAMTTEMGQMVNNAQDYIEWRNNQNSIELIRKIIENE